MIKRKVMAFSIFFILLNIFNLYALDFYEGNIRLSVDEKTGSISLYCLSDPVNMRYEPLFNAKEPEASLLSVKVDKTVYKLGKSSLFRVRVNTNDKFPVINYEAPNLRVIQAFAPVRTFSSDEANGIKMTITIQNVGNKPVSVGLKMLLDTHLGEKNRDDVHFITNRQIITKETYFEGTSGDLFWVSKNQNYSLMGSIVNPLDPSSKTPDFVHFANWRRLYNANWALRYSEGRSFDYWPYSPRDSAVCYFYEQDMLDTESSFSYTVFLTAEDFSHYASMISTDDLNISDYEAFSDFEDWSNFDFSSDDFESFSDLEVFSNNEDFFRSKDNSNLLLMYMLQETLNKFIDGEIYLDEGDLDDIERSIDELR